MKKILITISILLGLSGVAYAAPTLIYQRTLLPEADSTYNLGSSTNRWANIYGDTLYGDGSNLTGISAGSDTWEINASGQLTPTTTIDVLLPADLTVDGDTTLVDVIIPTTKSTETLPLQAIYQQEQMTETSTSQQVI